MQGAPSTSHMDVSLTAMDEDTRSGTRMEVDPTEHRPGTVTMDRWVAPVPYLHDGWNKENIPPGTHVRPGGERKPQKAKKEKKVPRRPDGQLMTTGEVKKILQGVMIELPLARVCEYHPEFIQGWLKELRMPRKKLDQVMTTAEGRIHYAITTVTAKIMHHRIREAVLDSGASACVISLETLRRAKLEHQMTGARGMFITAEGKQRTPHGWIEALPITLGTCTVMASAHVADGAHFELIIGTPWLHPAQAEISYVTHTVTMHKDGVRGAAVPIRFTKSAVAPRVALTARTFCLQFDLLSPRQSPNKQVSTTVNQEKMVLIHADTAAAAAGAVPMPVLPPPAPAHGGLYGTEGAEIRPIEYHEDGEGRISAYNFHYHETVPDVEYPIYISSDLQRSGARDILEIDENWIRGELIRRGLELPAKWADLYPQGIPYPAGLQRYTTVACCRDSAQHRFAQELSRRVSVPMAPLGDGWFMGRRLIPRHYATREGLAHVPPTLGTRIGPPQPPAGVNITGAWEREWILPLYDLESPDPLRLNDAWYGPNPEDL